MRMDILLYNINRFNGFMLANNVNIEIMDEDKFVDRLDRWSYGTWELLEIGSEIDITNDWFGYNSDTGEFLSFKNDIELLMFMNELLLQHV